MCVKMFYIFLHILEKGSCCMNLRNYQEVVYLRRMLELKLDWGKAAYLVKVSLKYYSSVLHLYNDELFIIIIILLCVYIYKFIKQLLLYFLVMLLVATSVTNNTLYVLFFSHVRRVSQAQPGDCSKL